MVPTTTAAAAAAAEIYYFQLHKYWNIFFTLITTTKWNKFDTILAFIEKLWTGTENILVLVCCWCVCVCV